MRPVFRKAGMSVLDLTLAFAVDPQVEMLGADQGCCLQF